MSAAPKDVQNVQGFGFDGYLRKPVILNDLIETMSEFLPYEMAVSKHKKHKTYEACFNAEQSKQVLELLQGEYLLQWRRVKESGDFSLMEAFATNLEELALKYECQWLLEYTQELLRDITRFDIERVDYSLNQFEEIIAHIKTIKDHNG